MTDLLPSLREIRVALLAGYGWLLIAWLALGDSVPTRSEALSDDSSAAALIARVLDSVGPVVGAIALSLAAYLVGSLLDELLRVALRIEIGPASGPGASQREQLRRAVTMDLQGYARMVRMWDPERAAVVQDDFDAADKAVAEATIRIHVTIALLAAALIMSTVRSETLAGVILMLCALPFAWHAYVYSQRFRKANQAIDMIIEPEYTQWETHHFG